MIRQLLCIGVMVLGASAARADVFSFTYTGTSILGATITTTGTITATAGLLGSYNITAITGTETSKPLFGSTSTWSLGSGSGSFTIGILGTIGFNVLGTGGGADTLTVLGSSATETGPPGWVSSGTISISRVPEAATLSLLFAMGLGVWFLARKLPTRKAPIS